MSPATKRRLLTVLVGLNLALIWGNSLMPGEESAATSDSLLAWLTGLLPVLGGEWGHTFIRKAAHFSEFALLGLLWCGRFRLVHGRVGFGQIGMGLAVACMDETIQIFTPDRASSLLDVWLDTAGFAVGLCLILLGHTIQKSKTTKGERIQ